MDNHLICDDCGAKIGVETNLTEKLENIEEISASDCCACNNENGNEEENLNEFWESKSTVRIANFNRRLPRSQKEIEHIPQWIWPGIEKFCKESQSKCCIKENDTNHEYKEIQDAATQQPELPFVYCQLTDLNQCFCHSKANKINELSSTITTENDLIVSSGAQHFIPNAGDMTSMSRPFKTELKENLGNIDEKIPIDHHANKINFTWYYTKDVSCAAISSNKDSRISSENCTNCSSKTQSKMKKSIDQFYKSHLMGDSLMSGFKNNSTIELSNSQAEHFTNCEKYTLDVIESNYRDEENEQYCPCGCGYFIEGSDELCSCGCEHPSYSLLHTFGHSENFKRQEDCNCQESLISSCSKNENLTIRNGNDNKMGKPIEEERCIDEKRNHIIDGRIRKVESCYEMRIKRSVRRYESNDMRKLKKKSKTNCKHGSTCYSKEIGNHNVICDESEEEEEEEEEEKENEENLDEQARKLQENIRIFKEKNEYLRKLIEVCHCLKDEAESSNPPPIRATYSGLTAAIKILKAKCRSKDGMIAALAEGLRNSKNIENIAKNLMAPCLSFTYWDFDRCTLYTYLRGFLLSFSMKQSATNLPRKHLKSEENDSESSKISEYIESEQSSNTETNSDEIIVPPTNLQIIKDIFQCLLVSWKKPQNVVNIIGYEIFINGDVGSRVRTPNRTETILNYINHSKPFEITLYAVGKNRRLSEPVTIIYPN